MDSQSPPPSLAVSMIVKDAEATLARCLNSVQEVATEIVIADTGSSDRGMEIARACGARVFSIPWENDFAKARNLSLARVTAEWVLMLDADEVLDPAAPALLPSHLLREGVMGYTVHIKNYLGNPNCHLWDQRAQPNEDPPPFARGYPAYVEHVNVRLFRRRPEIYFEGRVHETVGYRILDLGMWIDEASFTIHHLGFTDDEESQARKYIFYRDLGRAKVRDMPENALAHFELGVEEFEHFHNYAGAEEPLRRACELNPRLGVAWLFYGRALGHLNRAREGLTALEHAEDAGAKMEMVFEARGDLHYNLGEFNLALESYERAAAPQNEAPLLQSKRGFTMVRAGRRDEGLANLQRAIDREPGSPELYDRMIAACAWLGRNRAAAEMAEAKLARVAPQPESYLRAASLRAQEQDWVRALNLIQKGLEHFPKHEKLLQAQAESQQQTLIKATEGKGDEAFRNKDYAGAREGYRQAIERIGDLPRFESKLGLAEVLSGEAQGGMARMMRAMGREPRSSDLHDRVIAAWVALGRTAEAAGAAERKLDCVDPRPEGYLRAASLYVRLGDEPSMRKAVALVRAGLERFPQDDKLRSAAMELRQ